MLMVHNVPALKHSGGKSGGLPVEVIVADDQGKPDVARQTADRLVKQDQVDFMTGVVFSNVMLAAGKDALAGFKRFFKGEIASETYTPLSQLDDGSELSKMRASGFSADEDLIRAVGEPMLGMFNSSQWAHDMPNPANKRFVADFQKDYVRLPTLYAALCL
jgi:ABC-type branched-subunit amino acid transport system substrate-binding protein